MINSKARRKRSLLSKKSSTARESPELSVLSAKIVTFLLLLVSEREEEEVDMSFILPEPNVSLNYCVGNYSKPEKMTGRDKFKCDKCGDLVDAAKWSVIKTLPNFLSIHLRRFKYDETKQGITKLNWQIPFPFKLKIRTNYNEEDVKEGLYKLVGVVVHLGTG